MNRRISVYRDRKALWSSACALVRDIANRAVADRGVFTVALSGGRTPEELFSGLAGAEFRGSIPWEKVLVFWGDERYVPPDHPASNYGAAHRMLLSKVDIPEGRVFPIPTGLPAPEDAARAYEERVREALGGLAGRGVSGSGAAERGAAGPGPAVPGASGQSSAPRTGLDLVLLGMGNDGHTASLYPGGEALGEKSRWFRAVEAPDWATVRQRVTATLPLINGSRAALFLVSGDDKKDTLRKVLAGSDDAPVYPAQRVRPLETLYWLTDIQIWTL